MSQEVAYSIKYINEGVVEVRGEVTDDGKYWSSKPAGRYFERLGVGVFLTKDAAEVALQAKIKRKIASLNKQIRKLAGLLYK